MSSPFRQGPRVSDVSIPVGAASAEGTLTLPSRPVGLVLFAHGSGSTRRSPRNRFVASVLADAGVATLLFDLLTPSEELDRANVFDVELLGRRLLDATEWAREQPGLDGLPVGYFGASTGAAAALWAAAAPGNDVGAVVSRGGRPDLASAHLDRVVAPTLLIVGGHDEAVLRLNQLAQSYLDCENALAIVPGATHLFEELGTLRMAAEQAREWFVDHLGRTPASGDWDAQTSPDMRRAM